MALKNGGGDSLATMAAVTYYQPALVVCDGAGGGDANRNITYSKTPHSDASRVQGSGSRSPVTITVVDQHASSPTAVRRLAKDEPVAKKQRGESYKDLGTERTASPEVDTSKGEGKGKEEMPDWEKLRGFCLRGWSKPKEDEDHVLCLLPETSCDTQSSRYGHGVRV